MADTVKLYKSCWILYDFQNTKKLNENGQLAILLLEAVRSQAEAGGKNFLSYLAIFLIVLCMVEMPFS